MISPFLSCRSDVLYSHLPFPEGFLMSADRFPSLRPIAELTFPWKPNNCIPLMFGTDTLNPWGHKGSTNGWLSSGYGLWLKLFRVLAVLTYNIWKHKPISKAFIVNTRLKSMLCSVWRLNYNWGFCVLCVKSCRTRFFKSFLLNFFWCAFPAGISVYIMWWNSFTFSLWQPEFERLSWLIGIYRNFVFRIDVRLFFPAYCFVVLGT